MPKSERRTARRVKAEFEISYIHDKDYLISYTKDISVSGMFIRTENPPPVGEIISLKFSLGEHEPMSVKAKVVWTNDSESSFDYGMGVQFVDPPDNIKQAILNIVNRIAILEDKEK